MSKLKILVALALSYFSVQLFFPVVAWSQRPNIDERAIRLLIDEWNFANNTRSRESFAKVYAAQLLFYTEQVSKSRALTLKQKLFKKNPDFRQRIISDIRYTPYTSGVVKCDFTKEVREYTRWKQYPSYLLVSYDQGLYRVVGESDYATDRTLGYRLSIGQPMNLTADEPAIVETGEPDTTVADIFPAGDSAVMIHTDDVAEIRVDSVVSGRQTEVRTSITTLLSSRETVPVRKGHVFILIGVLVIGGLMIFIADSVQMRRRQRRKALRKSGNGKQATVALRSQTRFETFVLTLFDPLYFRYRRPRKAAVIAGSDSAHNRVEPDLEFKFRHKDYEARFSIHCKYHEQISADKIQLLSREELTKLKYFESDQNDVYYILGVGGKPDDPRELFIIPVSQIDREYVTREELEVYRKSGMFFYNSSTGKLQ